VNSQAAGAGNNRVGMEILTMWNREDDDLQDKRGKSYEGGGTQNGRSKVMRQTKKKKKKV